MASFSMTVGDAPVSHDLKVTPPDGVLDSVPAWASSDERAARLGSLSFVGLHAIAGLRPARDGGEDDCRRAERGGEEFGRTTGLTRGMERERMSKKPKYRFTVTIGKGILGRGYELIA